MLLQSVHSCRFSSEGRRFAKVDDAYNLPLFSVRERRKQREIEKKTERDGKKQKKIERDKKK